MTKTIALLLSLLTFPVGAFASVTIDGQVGPRQALSNGSENALRTTQSGELANSDAHGRYQEAVLTGNVFSLYSGAVTVAAGNATTGALGTILFIDGFYNPQTSKRLAAILTVAQATTSGTPGGPLFYNYYCGLNITSAATGTIRPGLLGNAAGGSQMVPQVNVIIAATPAATPAAIALGVVGGPAAIAAGAGIYSAVEDVGGRIIVPPGCVFGLAAAATGTSHVVHTQIVWEELVIP